MISESEVKAVQDSIEHELGIKVTPIISEEGILYFKIDSRTFDAEKAITIIQEQLKKYREEEDARRIAERQSSDLDPHYKRRGTTDRRHTRKHRRGQ